MGYSSLARGANSNFRRTLLETQFQQRFDDFVIYTEKSQIRHLKDVDNNASNKVKKIVNNLAKKDNFLVYYDGIIDKLEWVKTMNNYKNIAEELVYNELIYC